MSIPCQSNETDLPIALRKGIRLCTKHPLAKYVSHSHLSSSFSAFTTKLSGVDIPKNVQEALIVPKWKKAVLEELNALKKNGTWEKVSLPNGQTTVGCK